MTLSPDAIPDKFKSFFKGLENRRKDYEGSRLRAYLIAAAALVRFDPKTLLPAYGEPMSLDPVADEHIVDHILTQCSVIPKSEEAYLLSLRDRARRKILRGARPDEMIMALVANSDQPAGPMQAAYGALIHGETIDIDDLSSHELNDIIRFVGWLRQTVDTKLPDARHLQSVADRKRLFETFHFLANENFHGRESEIGRIRDYIGVERPDTLMRKVTKSTRDFFDLTSRPPLLISGPGGIGKSTLISHVILSHTSSRTAEPFTFVYMDFDRPGLIPEQPLTLLIEAIRQVGLQYPDLFEIARRLEASWADDLNSTTFHEDDVDGLTSEIGKVNFDQDMKWQINELADLLAKENKQDKPFLVVLDTFEEAQHLGPHVTDGLWRFFNQLQDVFPHFRLIIAGRADIATHKTDKMELKNFDEKASVGFLQTLLGQDRNVDEGFLRGIYDEIGGNPLSLKLAARVMEQEQFRDDAIDGLGGNWFIRHFIREETKQGQLYNRILAHIHDEDIRKLAYPGLILRRIDSDIISNVLAKPCEVDVPDMDEARRLFALLSKEAGLVAEDADGSLRHLPQVRRVMLDSLVDSKPETVGRIERRAIRYYKNLVPDVPTSPDERLCRAEEIYHRLRSGQSIATVVPRWVEGIESYLGGALDEIPLTSRAFLAGKLGRNLNEEEQRTADQETWERWASRSASRKLHTGDYNAALEILRQRDDRSPTSPVPPIEARALINMLDYEGALSVLEDAIPQAETVGDAELLLDLYYLRSEAFTATGELSGAISDAKTVRDMSKTLDNHLMELRAGLDVQLLTEHHWLSYNPAEDDDVQVAFNKLSDRELRANPRLARNYAVKVGEEKLEVLARVLKTVGLYNPDEVSREESQDVLSGLSFDTGLSKILDSGISNPRSAKLALDRGIRDMSRRIAKSLTGKHPTYDLESPSRIINAMRALNDFE